MNFKVKMVFAIRRSFFAEFFQADTGTQPQKTGRAENLLTSRESCIYNFPVTSFIYDYRTSLGFLTATTNRLMSALFRRNLIAAGLDLTVEQWAVLLQLQHTRGMMQEELADVLCLEKSSLSRVLNVLERRELIERRRDPEDARRRRIHPTQKADELHVSAQAAARLTDGASFADVAPEDLSVTRRTLTRIKQTLQETGR
jgi:DNA-binding MarR family transcriptional regulator